MEVSDKEGSKYLLSVDIRANLAPQNKRIRWKIDLIVLPIFLITQALQFMDKTALNYANLFGYQKALGLHGQQFNYLSGSKLPKLQSDISLSRRNESWESILSVVYAGYFFGQYPCGWLIGRFPSQRVLGISCFLWGIMVLILTQCRDYSSAREYQNRLEDGKNTDFVQLLSDVWLALPKFAYRLSTNMLLCCSFYGSFWSGCDTVGSALFNTLRQIDNAQVIVVSHSWPDSGTPGEKFHFANAFGSMCRVHLTVWKPDTSSNICVAHPLDGAVLWAISLIHS